jgi:predicted metal-dependent peptidase
MDAKTKLMAARLKATKNYPYLSTALMVLNPVFAKGLGTFAVDKYWRMYWDEVPWDVDEMSEVIAHEVWHLLRRHPSRAEVVLPDRTRETKETIAWRLAVDMEINDSLDKKRLPEGVVYPEAHGLEPHLLAESYYEKLKDSIDVTEIEILDITLEGQGGEGGGGGQGNQQGPLRGKVKVRINGKEHEIELGPGAGGGGSCADSVPKPWEQDSPKDSEGNKREGVEGGIDDLQGELIRREVAKKVLEHSKSRGSMPGGALRWADEMLNPKVNWKRELKAAIRASLATTAGAVDYSYSRPSRRQGALKDIILPSMRSPVPEVSVIIDTSGSISDKMLSQAMAEINGVLRACGQSQVTVMCVDAAVHTVQKVFNPKSIKLAGGGGTDMGAGLRRAEKLKPPPDVVIVLTDCYTPWPNRPPRFVDKVIVGALGKDAPVNTIPGWARHVIIDVDELDY